MSPSWRQSREGPRPGQSLAKHPRRILMKPIRTPRIGASPNVGVAGASAPDRPGRRDVGWLGAVLTMSALVLALIALALFQPSADAAVPAAHSQLQFHVGHEK